MAREGQERVTLIECSDDEEEEVVTPRRRCLRRVCLVIYHIFAPIVCLLRVLILIAKCFDQCFGDYIWSFCRGWCTALGGSCWRAILRLRNCPRECYDIYAETYQIQ